MTSTDTVRSSQGKASGGAIAVARLLPLYCLRRWEAVKLKGQERGGDWIPLI